MHISSISSVLKPNSMIAPSVVDKAVVTPGCNLFAFNLLRPCLKIAVKWTPGALNAAPRRVAPETGA